MRSSKVWNFSTVKPAPPPPHAPLHAYQVNHTCSLSHSLFLFLSLSHMHTNWHSYTASHPHNSPYIAWHKQVIHWPVALHRWVRGTDVAVQRALCRFILLSLPLFIFQAIPGLSLPFVCSFLLSLQIFYLSSLLAIRSPASIYTVFLLEGVIFLCFALSQSCVSSPSINELLFPALSGVSEHGR